MTITAPTLACTVTVAAATSLVASSLARSAFEGVSEVLWIVGWALAAWAVIAIVVAAGALVRSRRRRRRPILDSALVLASVAILVAIAVALPLSGSGGGTA